jgi:ABC-type transporter Mla subunit MlaD
MVTAVSWIDDLLASSRLVARLTRIERAVLHDIPARLAHLERLLMATADDLAARIDTATNEVAADLADVRNALAEAVANADAATQAAVNAELAKLDAPISRLEALGADPTDPVPSPEPAPQEPTA